MTEGGIGSVSVSVVPDAEQFWARFEAQSRAGAAEAGRRAGNEWSRGFQAGAGVPDIRVRADTSQARAQIAALRRDSHSLLGTILTLAPALTPVVAAAATGGAALASLGVAGVLAFKGIQADMKAANAEGLKFAAGVNVLKGDLQTLEDTSAHGVLASFQKTTAQLHAALPAVNADLAQSSRVLGDIAGHLLNAAVSGEHTFAPVLLQVSQYVDTVAARFEAWATGPGGAEFAAALAEDFRHVAPMVESVAGAVGHLVASSNGVGLAIVDELGVLARVLDSIPTPVLAALTTGIVSLRIAGAVSGLMDRLAVSIRGVAVAEGEATAASRARGGLAGAVGFIGKVGAGYLAARIAVDSLSKATDGAQTSTDGLSRKAAQFVHVADQLVHLDVGGALKYLSGGAAKDDRQARANKELSDSYDHLLGSAKVFGHSMLDSAKHTAALNERQVDLFATIAAGHTVFGKYTVGQAIAIEQTKILTENSARLGSVFADLHGKIGGGGGVTQLAAGFTQAQSAIQANVAAGEKFVKLGGKVKDEYKGVNVTLGMYQAALDATGGDQAKAIGYIHGQIDALGQNRAALTQLAAEQQNISTYVSDAGTKYKLTSQQIDVYTAALGLNVEAITRGGSALTSAESMLGKFVDTLRNGSTALDGWLAAVDQWTKSSDTVADRASLIGAALKASNGDMLDYANTMVQAATANQQLVTDFRHVADGVVNLKKGTIDYHNAAAAPLLADLSNLQTSAMNAAAATYQHERSLGVASAASDAFAVYTNDTRGALIKQAEQLGITKGQARKLADEYFGIKNSGDLKKQIALIGQDKVLTALHGILEDLDILAGKHVTSYVDIITTLTENRGTAGQRHAVAQASGGFISGPGSGTSDSIPAWLSNGEFVVNARQTAKHRNLLHAINAGMQGFAGGGDVPPELGGFTGVNYGGSSGGGSGGGSSSGSSRSRPGPSKRTLAAFDSSALSNFLNQIGITTNAFTQAKNGLVAALHDAKISARQSAAVARTADRLIAYSQRIQTVTDRITRAQERLANLREQSAQEKSSVASSVMGLFDLSSAGVQQQIYRDRPAGPVTPASFLASLTASADRAGTTRTELKALESRAKGNKALTALVQQLAENPQSAQPQIDALAGASKGDLANIAKQYGRLQASASGAGSDISALLYGAGVKAARGLAEGLISERRTIISAMHSVAHDMDATIRHDLKLRSPSRTFHEHGRNVVAGLVNGIIDSLPQTRSAAGRLGSSLDLGGTSARAAGRGGDTWQFYGLQDPVAIGTAVARRQQMLARY